MLFRLLADGVVIIHLLFVAFVVGGAFLAFRWRWMPRVHIPAALWGVTIEWTGWICPLTPLENLLREAGGEAAYSGGFVANYVLPVLYPAGLTRSTQFGLGVLVLIVNLVAYGILYRKRSQERGAH